MTEAGLMAIAEKVSAQRIAVEMYDYANTPRDYETCVKLDASIMIARDKLAVLQIEYAAALCSFVNQQAAK